MGYLVLVSESNPDRTENYGVEKSPDMAGLGTLVPYVDYISPKYSDGSLGEPDNRSVGDDGTISAVALDYNNDMTLLTDLPGLSFLLGKMLVGPGAGADRLTPWLDPANYKNRINMASPTSTLPANFALSDNNGNKNVNSYTIYAEEVFDDNEKRMIGAQPISITMDISKTDDIGVSITSKPNFSMTPPAYSGFIPSVPEKLTGASVADIRVIDLEPYDISGNPIIAQSEDPATGDLINDWFSIGCDVSAFNFSWEGSVGDEAYFCPVEFGSGNFYGRRVLENAFKTVNAELTIKQTNSEWNQRFYGALGLAMYSRVGYFALQLVIQDPYGRKAFITYPRATFNYDGPSLEPSGATNSLSFMGFQGSVKPTAAANATDAITTSLVVDFKNLSASTASNLGQLSFTPNMGDAAVTTNQLIVKKGSLYIVNTIRVKGSTVYQVRIPSGNYSCYVIYTDGTKSDTKSFTLAAGGTQNINSLYSGSQDPEPAGPSNDSE